MEDDYTEEFPDIIDTPDDSDWDSPPSPELIESLDFWVGEDDGDDPVFPNSYPCDEDWDAPANS